MLSEIILAQPAIMKTEKQTRHEETPPLGDDRTESHALHRHLAHEDQQQRSDDIHHILRQRNHHRNTGVLHTDKPSRKPIQTQYGRSTPDADIAVSAGKLHHISLRRHRPEATPNEPFLEHEEQQTNPHTDA